MTREEQIFEASKTYSEYEDNQTIYENGFINGAEWADSNPISKWISVKEDLPCNHIDLVLKYNDIPFSTKRVLVMTDIHTLFLCEMKKDDGLGWIWNISTKDKITHWFPIPKSPK